MFFCTQEVALSQADLLANLAWQGEKKLFFPFSPSGVS